MKILLIGSGGREHALAWKLAQSKHCEKLYCAPGNAGISEVAECLDIAAEDHAGLITFALQNEIKFVVIGPEQPLVDGLGDAFRNVGLKVFGPSKIAAQMEGSKGFMKDFCARHNIPTAAYARFKSLDKAVSYIKEQGAPIVIKTDGLAAGKGVIIAQSVDEAIEAATDMLSGKAFGDAGMELVIEEFMDGEEVSYFALADGQTYLPLTSAQDHKRVGDGDTGLNTGGMGAYSPAHFMDDALEKKIIDQIIQPTVVGMAKDGTPFKGVLFAGLMVKNGEPKLIEYNIRFGDPECQPIIMRLESDLVELLLATDEETLSRYQENVKWSDKATLCVVMAAKGYPGKYEKGTEIKGTDDIKNLQDVRLFHAGTMRDNSGTLVGSGGRVLGIVGIGDTIAQAQHKAYQGVDQIDWPDGFCRRDIGWRAIAAAKEEAA
ncbi:MAG: phosphoribosylamine--glycine ligase [Alphaproteobacteria bacterium]